MGQVTTRGLWVRCARFVDATLSVTRLSGWLGVRVPARVPFFDPGTGT